MVDGWTLQPLTTREFIAEHRRLLHGLVITSLSHHQFSKDCMIKSPIMCNVPMLTVKAVHLDSEAFIATLHRFIGYSSLLWSEFCRHEFNQFLETQITQGTISEFCSVRNVEWKLIPVRSSEVYGSRVSKFTTPLKS